MYVDYIVLHTTYYDKRDFALFDRRDSDRLRAGPIVFLKQGVIARDRARAHYSAQAR